MEIMKKRSAGFTLIEVIASLLLMSIVAVIAGMGLVQGINAYMLTRTSAETMQRTEYALNRIKLEFMNMDTVTAATAESITFTSNKAVDHEGTYTIVRDGNMINLIKDGVSNPLLTGVGTGGSFLVYSNNAGGAWVYTDGFAGIKTCSSSSLNSITINLIITRSDGGGDITFTTSVNPRNNECVDGPKAVSVGQ